MCIKSQQFDRSSPSYLKYSCLNNYTLAEGSLAGLLPSYHSGDVLKTADLERFSVELPGFEQIFVCVRGGGGWLVSPECCSCLCCLFEVCLH